MNEMQFLKKYRNFMIIISLVYLIVGIALMLAPERMGNILGFVFGAIAFVFGIYRLVVYFRQPKLELMLATDLFIGVGCTVLGFVSLLCYRQVLTYATFIFGFLLIAAGVVKMQNSINLQQLGYDNWWVSMILGFASIGLSVVVFVKPKPVADNFLFIMGAFFVVAAAFILASLIMSEMYYNRLRQNPEMDAVPARDSVSNPFSPSAAAAAPASEESANTAGAVPFEAAAGDSAEFQAGEAAGTAAAAATVSAAPAEAPRTGGPFDSLMFWKKKEEKKPEDAEKLQGEVPGADETSAVEDPFSVESSHDTSSSGFGFEADSKAEEVPAEDTAAEAAPAEGESAEADSSAEEVPAASDEAAPAPWDSGFAFSEADTTAAAEEAAPAEEPAAEEAVPAEEPAAEEAAPAEEEAAPVEEPAVSEEKTEEKY